MTVTTAETSLGRLVGKNIFTQFFRFKGIEGSFK